MKPKILLLIIGVLALLQSYVFGQECATSFTSHSTGSIISNYPVNISGTATKPLNGHVWILAHLEGFDGWYPQGNGERTITDSKWVCTVYLGVPGETGFYEIAIAVVNDDGNQALNNWVRTARANGYPPIPFPGVINNCSINRIRVEKR
ncbi:MAG TPA: hypothetical protein VIK55_03930 [Paludibacter sp.]